jgi:hypothetical protein
MATEVPVFAADCVCATLIPLLSASVAASLLAELGRAIEAPSIQEATPKGRVRLCEAFDHG